MPEHDPDGGPDGGGDLGSDLDSRELDSRELEPGETILASLLAKHSSRATGNIHHHHQPAAGDGVPTFGRTFGSGRRHRRVSGVGRYLQWREGAQAAGFPDAGMAMHLQVTDRRVRVFSASFIRGRPRRYVGSVGLGNVAQVTVQRAVFGTHIVFLMQDGQLVSIETGSARNARRFANALLEARDRRPRPSS